MLYPLEGFLEINEDMAQILLISKVLFTQDSEAVNLFCGLLPALNPACSSAIISSALDLRLLSA